MSLLIVKASLQSQLGAALGMMEECLQNCPDEYWGSLVASYPLWMVAYSTLCFTDLYLAKSNSSWKPDRGTKDGPPGLHPKGHKALSGEYPSHRFERAESLRYVHLYSERVAEAQAAETAKTLAGPSCFSWIAGPRAEVHLYNVRHLAHYTG